MYAILINWLKINLHNSNICGKMLICERKRQKHTRENYAKESSRPNKFVFCWLTTGNFDFSSNLICCLFCGSIFKLHWCKVKNWKSCIIIDYTFFSGIIENINCLNCILTFKIVLCNKIIFWFSFVIIFRIMKWKIVFDNRLLMKASWHKNHNLKKLCIMCLWFLT